MTSATPMPCTRQLAMWRNAEEDHISSKKLRDILYIPLDYTVTISYVYETSGSVATKWLQSYALLTF